MIDHLISVILISTAILASVADTDPLQKSFVRACRNGHITTVQSMVETNNVEVNWIPPPEEQDWMPPLIEAILSGNTNTAKILLEHGADVNMHFDRRSSMNTGYRPVSYALERKNKAMVLVLAAYDFDPDFFWQVCFRNQNLVLYVSVWHHMLAYDKEVFKALVEMEFRRVKSGAIRIDTRNSVDGYRLLDLIAMFGTEEQIEAAIQLGAHPDDGTVILGYGSSYLPGDKDRIKLVLPPLVHICKHDSLYRRSIVRALLKDGADINANLLAVPELILEGKVGGKLGRTALWYACSRRRSDIVAELLQLGASPLIDDAYGITPLVNCIRHNDMESMMLMLRALKQRGDDIKKHITRTCSLEWSPVDYASITYNFPTIRVLMLLGAPLGERVRAKISNVHFGLLKIWEQELAEYRRRALRMIFWGRTEGELPGDVISLIFKDYAEIVVHEYKK